MAEDTTQSDPSGAVHENDPATAPTITPTEPAGAAPDDAGLAALAAGIDAAPATASIAPVRAADPAPEPSRLHTYPDGSARVGVPPFPAMSPLEEEAAAKRDPELIARQQATALAAAGGDPSMVRAANVVQAQ